MSEPELRGYVVAPVVAGDTGQDDYRIACTVDDIDTAEAACRRIAADGFLSRGDSPRAFFLPHAIRRIEIHPVARKPTP